MGGMLRKLTEGGEESIIYKKKKALVDDGVLKRKQWVVKVVELAKDGQ